MRLIDADKLSPDCLTKDGKLAISQSQIANASTIEPCYQTTSCLDCKNYDKENHNCPRYCEVIKEAIKSRPQGETVIKCKNCKYQVKEWREDKRMKENGYWVYGCRHFGDLMGYWGFGGNDNEFCSDAEQKGGADMRGEKNERQN